MFRSFIGRGEYAGISELRLWHHFYEGEKEKEPRLLIRNTARDIAEQIFQGNRYFPDGFPPDITERLTSRRFDTVNPYEITARSQPRRRY